MIKHAWSVACTSRIFNRETNNLTLIECLESITVRGTPESEEERRAIPLTVAIVSLWTRPVDQPTQGTARISFLNPTDEVLGTHEYTINLVQFPRLRGTANLVGLAFQGPGIYHFRVEVQEEGEGTWKEVALLPLEIEFQATEQQTP